MKETVLIILTSLTLLLFGNFNLTNHDSLEYKWLLEKIKAFSSTEEQPYIHQSLQQDLVPPAVICYGGLSVNLSPVDRDGDQVPDSQDGEVVIAATDLIANHDSDAEGDNQIQYSIFRAADIDAGQVPNSSQSELALRCTGDDVVKVYVYGWDTSGNSQRCETQILINDFFNLCSDNNEAESLNLPSIVCRDGINATLLPVDLNNDKVPDLGQGISMVAATDFIVNYDPGDPIRYSIELASDIDSGAEPLPDNSTITFTCSDPEVALVYVYAWDESLNYNRCEAIVVISDFLLDQKLCSDTITDPVIAPTFNCNFGLAAELLPGDANGDQVPDPGIYEVILSATDFLPHAGARNDPALRYSVYRANDIDNGLVIPDSTSTRLVLNCDDPEAVITYIYGWDEQGNSSRCQSYAIVKDYRGLCDPKAIDNKMVSVAGGTFTMGCTPEQESECEDNEKPAHPVTLGNYQIGQYELTQGEWNQLMGSNPSFHQDCGDYCPVEQVSWYDAIVFCNRLSESEGLSPCYYSDAGFSQVYGKSGDNWTLPNSGAVFWRESADGYRLPTEAEWEYAARGGNQSQGYKYPGSNNLDEVAWWDPEETNLGPTRSIGQKLGNELNIFDMAGNVDEWCWDGWDPEYYETAPACSPTGPATSELGTKRGCSYECNAFGSRISDRSFQGLTSREADLGFRLVRGAVDRSQCLNPCRASDSLALRALYEAAGGPNWTNPWDLEEPINRWSGVTINEEGCVGELFLSGRQLAGNIPPELGNLKGLVQLNLAGNALQGSIPSELGNLDSLAELDLSKNQLRDLSLLNWTDLVQLISLDLSENEFSGEIPKTLGNLVNLRSLFLGDNQFNGEIPVELSNLDSLRYLHLNNNQLFGEIPPELGDLVALGTAPVVSDGSLAFLSSIGGLDLSNNKLIGEIPAELSQLDYVDLRNNDLSGCFREALIELCIPNDTVIVYIPPSIPFNPLGRVDTIAIIRYDFSNNPQLPWSGDFSQLCAGENPIGAPCDDGNPNTINDVITSDCNCAGTLVNSCRSRDSLTLIEFYTSTNGPNWTEPWNLENPMDSWSGVSLNDDGCVRILRPSGRNLSGEVSSILANLLQLEFLDLSMNNLQGTISSELGDLTKLRNLNLSGNNFQGAIPPELGSLMNLQDLDLSENNLEGTIPPELGDLMNLKEIDLSGNQLSGCIPEEIRPFCSLTTTFIDFGGIVRTFPAYDFSENPKLPWEGRLSNWCSGTEQIGAPCEDGNPGTKSDRITEGCVCEGVAVKPCRTSDSLSLVSLYESTGGPNWDGSWDLSMPLETWNGVNCNEDGCVIKIDLSDRNLAGGLPASLGGLESLQELDLSQNQLSGSIPDAITNLQNLRVLSLSDNQFDDLAITDWSNWQELTNLDLSENLFVGNIPSGLTTLKKLRSLSLSNNEFIGNIPEALSDLDSLRNLDLSNNKLEGEIPVGLGDLVLLGYKSAATTIRLGGLDLSNNKLTGPIPAKLGLLGKVNLQNNDLSGCFANEFLQLCQPDTFLLPTLGPPPFFTPGLDTFLTIRYDFSNNPQLPWSGDFSQFCAGEDPIGAFCDDGNPDTNDDTIQEDCRCGQPCPVIAQPSIAEQQWYCQGDPFPTLEADVAANIEVVWYGMPTGGDPLATSNTFQPDMPGIYYAESRLVNTSCVSDERTAVEVMEIALEVDAITTTCNEIEETYALSFRTLNEDELLVSFGTPVRQIDGSFRVEDVPSGMDVTLTLKHLVSGCEYEFTVVGPNCSCADLAAPLAVGDTELSYCDDAPIPQLSVSAASGVSVNWLDENGLLLQEDVRQFRPLGPGVYFAEAQRGVCKSEEKTRFEVKSFRTPTISKFNNYQCLEGTRNYTATITISNATSIVVTPEFFYSNEGDVYTFSNLSLDASFAIVATGPAGCVATRNFSPPTCDCPDLARPVLSESFVEFCPGDELKLIRAQVDPGLEVNWYDAPIGGRLIAENQAEFLPPGAGQFHAEVFDRNTGCFNPIRTPLNVFETLNAPFIEKIRAFCEPGDAAYSVEVQAFNAAGLIPTPGDVGGQSSGPNQRIFTGIPIDQQLSILAVSPEQGCEFTFAADPPDCSCDTIGPPVPEMQIVEICDSEALPVLKVKPPGPGFTADWFSKPLDGELLANATNQYLPTIAGTFYAQTVPLNGEECVSQERVGIQVRINPNYTIVDTTNLSGGCTNTEFSRDTLRLMTPFGCDSLIIRRQYETATQPVLENDQLDLKINETRTFNVFDNDEEVPEGFLHEVLDDTLSGNLRLLFDQGQWTGEIEYTAPEQPLATAFRYEICSAACDSTLCDTATVFFNIDCAIKFDSLLNFGFNPSVDGPFNPLRELKESDSCASNFESARVRIFNKHGQAVFDRPLRFSDRGWDGSRLPTGTYFWQVFLDNGIDDKPIQGTVLLLQLE